MQITNLILLNFTTKYLIFQQIMFQFQRYQRFVTAVPLKCPMEYSKIGKVLFCFEKCTLVNPNYDYPHDNTVTVTQL